MYVNKIDACWYPIWLIKQSVSGLKCSMSAMPQLVHYYKKEIVM